MQGACLEDHGFATREEALAWADGEVEARLQPESDVLVANRHEVRPPKHDSDWLRAFLAARKGA